MRLASSSLRDVRFRAWFHDGQVCCRFKSRPSSDSDEAEYRVADLELELDMVSLPQVNRNTV